MRAFDIQKKFVDGEVELSAAIEGKRISGQRLWYRFPEEYGDDVKLTGTPFLTSLLLSAMRDEQTLDIEGPVDRLMMESVPQVMAIFQRWNRLYKAVDIRAAELTSFTTQSSSVGSFFSAGVDAFYTLLKHSDDSMPAEPKITHLFFAHGFDIDLENADFYRLVLPKIREIADSVQKKLIPCSTNIRNLTIKRLGWSWQGGSATLSVAHCLPLLFRAVYIGSNHTYADDVAWGGHPLIDPLWSTGATRVFHDGCEATRSQKIERRIAKSDVALKYLRVCNQFSKKTTARYNCGTCEKCQRTKLNLFTMGVLGRCGSLDNDLDSAVLRKMITLRETDEAYVRENLAALRKMKGNPQARELEAALEYGLRRCARLRYPLKAFRMIERTSFLNRPASVVKKWIWQVLSSI